MKTLLLYSLLMLASMVASSQPKIPDYGKIDKADLLMTDCDFDAGAPAFKLLDYGKVRFAKSKYLNEKDLTGQNESMQGKLLKVDITDNGADYKQAVDVDIIIDNKGKASGKALVNSYGYAKAPRVDTWLHNKDKFGAEHLASPKFSFAIDSLQVNNTVEDTLPLQQEFTFALPVNNSGAYYYITTNLFTGLVKNPFTDDERRTDVEFRYYQAYYLNVNITVPPGFVFEELPPSNQLAMPDNSIECSRTILAKGNKLSLQMTVMFNQSTIKAKNYGFLKDFYKKLFNLLEEPVVVKQQ